MEQETRNALQKATQRIRRILEDEFAEQLEGTFDILASGKILPQAGAHLNARQVLTRQKLVDAIEHIRAGGRTPQEAVQQYTREAAFTFLNRFVALRMLESRGMLQECVSKGDQSAGFREFCGLAPGLAALEDGGYRLYLECLFDELSVEIKVLFDRRDSASLLWPRRGSLTGVLEVLQQRELAGVWSEDETIGWVYQYYNDEAERKQMRAESAAPRNSRELAVRNQFFTPRYVVEFLTDNTLGRIWYEMTRGQTVLRDRCRYLVRRPAEIFLQPGEAAPESPASDEQNTVANLSQEELLRQPVYILHRALKDPREIRLLDPACGSMHFGLYAFDLFTAIWEEAWEIANGQNEVLKTEDTFAAFVEFASTFADKTAFQREVPRLIIQHNIHGIDIDPRAAQIANLSIWLRAQRSWHQLGTKWSDRPRILRSNIVCAEPMPGEKSLLREFIEQQFQEDERPAFAFLLEKIFDRMTLAGEAGSLLRIEEEIRTAVAEAQKLAVKQSGKHQQQLFVDDTQSEMQRSEFDLRGLNDKQFWQAAEQRIYDALEAYAGQAGNSGEFQRRLFANNAAQGFAFIDLCRKRYDVVVMNPPFGERSESCEQYFKANFPKTIGDLLSMFFEQALFFTTARGKVGAITNRTWLSLPTFVGLRTQVFGLNGCVEVAADLGSFVLDAQVETATAVIGRDVPPLRLAPWVRLLKTKAKNDVLLQAVAAINAGRRHQAAFFASQQQFLTLPACVYGYWMSSQLISLYRPEYSIGARAAEVKQGTATADDFRFLRLAWEIATSNLGLAKTWLRFAKGGEYSPFFDDVHLALYWKNGGEEIIAWGCGRPQNTQYFARHGVTWPCRTTSAFGPRPLPAGCAFGHKGPAAFPMGRVDSNLLLGLLVSRPARLLLSVRLGAGDDAPGSASKSYEVGLVRDLPFPHLSPEQSAAIAAATADCVRLMQSRTVEDDETTAYFVRPLLTTSGTTSSILDAIAAIVTKRDSDFIEFSRLSSEIDDAVCDALGFVESDRTVMWEELERPITYFDDSRDVDPELFKRAYLTKDAINEQTLPGGLEAENDVRVQTQRKRQVVLRNAERICRLFEIAPSKFAELRQKHSLIRDEDITDAVGSLLQYQVGAVLGRWDIRYATGERPAPELPDPFAPLPACPPGMLQGDDGMPLSPEAGRQLRAEGRYPLDVAWDGILVDDPEHPLDIVRRVHDALAVLWGERADATQQEACALLGMQTLREWFRRPAGFFADHLKRYSKSRRKAPIYWPISTPNSSYTVWLYYHRFSKDTFFKVREIVDEKQGYEQRKLQRLKEQYGTQPTRSQAKEMETQEKVANEIKAMCEEIDRIAPLWNPNLNDGVIINFAPLWRLVPQHKAWQKECKECWDELVAGNYNWAHLAMHLWPERVVPKCVSDASLAIAHGLEETFWQRDDRDRLQPKPQPIGGWQPFIDELVHQRSSPAVKAALKSLLEAPVAGAGAKKGRGRRGATS